MKHVLRLALALAFPAALAAGEPVTGRPASLAAPDGTKLAASFYPASRPGPGVLLLHQCNRDRSSWNGLAAQLADKGFHVLTLDYRGYGDSGGARFNDIPFQERVRITAEKWPGDIDVAFAYLRAQPGVRVDAIGAAGASCGVNNSIQLSLRHPEVKSLVLLSGDTDRKGRQHLKSATGLPILFAASDDDGDVVSVMTWIDATSGNKANRFLEYAKGGHGTEMFKAHPELPGQIVAWFELTLMGKGPGVSAPPRPATVDAATRLRMTMDESGGAARVARSLAAERKKDPKSALLAAPFVNQLGYEAIAARRSKGGDRDHAAQRRRASALVQRVGQPRRRLSGRRPEGEGSRGVREKPRARGLRHVRDRRAARRHPPERAGQAQPAQEPSGRRSRTARPPVLTRPGAGLVSQQPALAEDPSAVPGEGAVLAHQPMTGHDHAHGIRAVRVPDRPNGRRPTDPARQLRVGQRRSARDRA